MFTLICQSRQSTYTCNSHEEKRNTSHDLTWNFQSNTGRTYNNMAAKKQRENHHNSSQFEQTMNPNKMTSLYRQNPVPCTMQAADRLHHTFMIEPLEYDESDPNQQPQPATQTSANVDRWDENHTRMPYSKNNLNADGTWKWDTIHNVLTKLKANCEARKATFSNLKESIETINRIHYDMSCLEELMNKVLSVNDKDYFMFKIIPKMVSLALTADKICGPTPPLLKAKLSHSITMSQHQAACLLCCGFFCLFPPPQDTYQSLNFNLLFQKGAPWKIEKLKCIFNYFICVAERMPRGVITFERSHIDQNDLPKWIASNKLLSTLHVDSHKSIEDFSDLLQVDFANAYVGGGVMNEGILQEEIRFTICPEMMISVLFCEVMHSTECIFIIGAEQFSKYDGYATNFRFAGKFEDNTPRDSWGRKLTHVVAMDAICFGDPQRQYEIPCMRRELEKAYVSFTYPKSVGAHNYGIATGRWGCGAFNGDPELKAILQLIAASEVGRPLTFTTWHQETFANYLLLVYQTLLEQRSTVGNIYHYLEAYSSFQSKVSLFQFILEVPISKIVQQQLVSS